MTQFAVAALMFSLSLFLGCTSTAVRLPDPVPPSDSGPIPSPDTTTPERFEFQEILEEAAAKEVVGRYSGYVVAVHDQGELAISRGFGTVAEDSPVALTPLHLFAFPALTEVLTGVLAGALHEQGVLDVGAPISTYLPQVSLALGRIRLGQLLTHTSGLDNARPPEEEDWKEILDDLDDRALFTEPGAIYSYSWYSYPLAVRVLERASGVSFQEAVETAILRPLGMNRSTFDPEAAVNLGLFTGIADSTDSVPALQVADIETERMGLPVLFTTSGDVLRFFAMWMEGGLKGSLPLEAVPVGTPSIPRSWGSYGGGVWVDEFDGIPRVYRIRRAPSIRPLSPMRSKESVSFHLFPHSRSALVIWGVERVPELTSSILLSRLHEVISLRGDGGTVHAPDRPKVMGSTLLISAMPEDGWVGRYINGEYFAEIRESGDGLIYFTGFAELEVTRTEDGKMEARIPDGRKAFDFLLLSDASGRRYLVLPDSYGNDRAYLHKEDWGR